MLYMNCMIRLQPYMLAWCDDFIFEYAKSKQINGIPLDIYNVNLWLIKLEKAKKLYPSQIKYLNW